MLSQPEIVFIGCRNRVEPANSAYREAQLFRLCGAGICGKCLILELSQLIFGHQVIAALLLSRLGETTSNKSRMSVLDKAPVTAVLTYLDRQVFQRAVDRYLHSPKGHGPLARHRQDHILHIGFRIVIFIWPWFGECAAAGHGTSHDDEPG